jgi:hypothetical protein
VILSLVLCFVAFVASFKATRQSISTGVIATIAVGYSYGILRGNLEQPASHFIYDAAALGMFLAMLRRPIAPVERFRLRPLMPWFLFLAGWPLLLFFVPAQDALVQLVGLRGNVFFLPFLLVGTMMTSNDFSRIARAFAILNIAALVVALAEAGFGLQHFYAVERPVNDIIFRSNDVVYGGAAHYRIPASFVSSAAYASTMIATLPVLIGGLVREVPGSRWRYLVAIAIGVTALGVFLAGSRSAVVLLMVLGIATTLPSALRYVPRGTWVALITAVALVVAVTPRMQRFITLQNTNFVRGRIYGSINENFFLLAADYPLGNGLGGGGTSLPYFLRDRVINPVVLENEYARIMAEQGIPGLTLWISFIIWLMLRPPSHPRDQWYRGKSLARLFCFISFASAPLGIGLLDTIPSTEMLLLLAGWFAAPEPMSSARPEPYHLWWQASRSRARAERLLHA